jgi:hypothetical protein
VSEEDSRTNHVEPCGVCGIDHLIDVIYGAVVFDVTGVARHDDEFTLPPLGIICVQRFLYSVVITFLSLLIRGRQSANAASGFSARGTAWPEVTERSESTHKRT